MSANLLLQSTAKTLRIDITEERLFTLSPGTHNILAKLEEPIELHFFYSQSLGREAPFYSNFARRVRELLSEIAAASNGQIRLFEHDPEPFSRAEDRAVSLGIQGIPIVQNSEELAYFGLAGINLVDETRAIPFFQAERENLLEYDLVSLIHTLTAPDSAVVGIISTLPILGDMNARLAGQPSPQWAIAENLSNGFEIRNLPQSFDELPKGLDLLILVHPQKLGARELFEIEQFLFAGGRALIFVDPKSEAPSAMASVAPSEASSSTENLKPLLDTWGVRVPATKLVADKPLAWRIDAGNGQQTRLVDYLVWLRVTAEYLSRNDPVTANIQVLNLASTGYIEPTRQAPLEVDALISSSQISSSIGVDSVAGLRPDFAALEASFSADPNTYIIAARLQGNATTAFADGAPTRTISRAESGGDESYRKEGPVHVILVADSDLLRDVMWQESREFFGRKLTRATAANATFLLNAVENLTGSEDLIALRSRGVSRRPFSKIDAIREAAEQALRDREQSLKQKLQQTREKIDQMEGGRGANPSTGAGDRTINLSPEQRTEIETLREEMLVLRNSLRGVQRELREDVEQLKMHIYLINIAAVPIVVALIASVIALFRAGRRQRQLSKMRA